MANGGRGWFQRRKPHADPRPSTPQDVRPEPTRLEAYEAQRRSDTASGGAAADASARPDFDSLLRPSEPVAVVDPTERAPMTPRTETRDSEADRRWAPPEEPRDTSGPTAAPVPRRADTRSPDAGESPEPPTGPVERTNPPVASVPADEPRFAPPEREDPARSEVERPRASTRYDWDAATAAALSGDAAPDSSPTGRALPHSDADRLLEDIIREIVGDATAETVSSLHQPRPVHDDPVTRESRPAVSDPGRSEPVPDHPTAVVESAAGDDVERGSEASTNEPETVPGAGSDAASGSFGPYAVVAGDEPEIAPGVQDVEHAGPAFHPYAAATSHAVVADPDESVSRETLESHGGTPLADQLADETRRRLALDQAVLPLPENTRVFTISNQKGGVGKTTSAVNLAAALARAGAHVLVVDLDPQGNASTALGVDHRSELRSVYEVLVSDLPIADVVQKSTEHENLDCVPATIHLAGAEIELVSLVAREQRLRRALDAHLAAMERPYDYVFIDCPPSLGLLTINAFVAAREVLIPIQCEYYALEGLSQLLSNIELIERHLNPELRLTTILLTMYDSRTNLAQQVAQDVRDHFPTQTLDTIIPRSVRVSEAPSYGQSVISYDFASTGSLSYREAAAEIAWRGAQDASDEKESN